jgi:hypothetical protein
MINSIHIGTIYALPKADTSKHITPHHDNQNGKVTGRETETITRAGAGSVRREDRQ